MSDKMVKQDINFLEFPLWFQDKYEANDAKFFLWEDSRGYTYKSAHRPPVKVDIIILLHLLFESQKDNWNEDLEISRYSILKACKFGTDKHWYERLEDSFERWTSVLVSFEGNFFDGKNYKKMQFHIIDSWKLEKKTNKLYVRFSPEWLMTIKESTFFKLINFEHVKSLRSPLATRLYEILSKNFQSRDRWEIGAKKLAEKIPMKQIYPANIIPKIESALNRILKETSLKLSLTIQKPRRGKAILIFEKIKENKKELSVLSIEEEEEWNILFSLLPQTEQKKNSIKKLLRHHLEKEDFKYIERNILYANEFARKNYGVFLKKALEGDWACYWSEDIKEDIEDREKSENVIQPGKFATADELLVWLKKRLEQANRQQYYEILEQQILKGSAGSTQSGGYGTQHIEFFLLTHP